VFTSIVKMHKYVVKRTVKAEIHAEPSAPVVRMIKSNR